MPELIFEALIALTAEPSPLNVPVIVPAANSPEDPRRTIVEAPVLLGTVDVQVNSLIDVTGVYAVGRVGTVLVSIDAIANVTGVRTVVKLNRVNVWGLIDPVQAAGWTDITPSQSSNWTEVIAA